MRPTFMALAAAAAAAVWFSAAPAQSIDPIVDVARFGETNLKAIDASGNLMTTYFPSTPTGTWWLVGNIPTLASRPATAPFVAISERYRPTRLAPNPSSHCALTADGDIYADGGGLSTWYFSANISQISGHQPQGAFVALCVGEGLTALTDRGERYRSADDLVTWEFSDSIPDELGVVPTAKSSIGTVKAAFR